MRRDKSKFQPLRWPDRRHERSMASIDERRRELTDDDVRELRAVLGLGRSKGRSRLAAARAFIDRQVRRRSWLLVVSDVGVWQTSREQIERETDELRRAARDLIDRANRANRWTRELLASVWERHWPQWAETRSEDPHPEERWPWLLDVYALQYAANRAHRIARSPRRFETVRVDLGMAPTRRTGPGRPFDRQNFELARIGVRAFERFAAKGPKATARRAKVVEIVVRRASGDALSLTEPDQFATIARRALTEIRRGRRRAARCAEIGREPAN